MINKKELVQCIINALTRELQQALSAANEAHAAAVDDQSVAETQYDTLAIEAGYLAEGQSKRVMEFQGSINVLTALTLPEVNENSIISQGNLVQLAQEESRRQWYFISPVAGGFQCQQNQENITVITPKSPMGDALLGKQLDDDIDLVIADRSLNDYILHVL